ncbi:MAG: L-iditol 2-dehydrogenase [Geminicoccaceae bacterium]|nr:L-iditol 2-dehydrogenase [Geminicoccaceae bacterium]HRY26362.1 L-iditol 2-dehydrogenase [Geminicoccaceae bacterium]
MKLKDRVAVITGGARGIGRAIAERYADEGARVVVADILEAEAKATAQAIGRGAFGLKVDVTDQASIDAMVKAVVDEAGRIDILVNNAAIFNMAPVLEVTREDWDRNFDINTKGLFFTLQAVARRMVEQAAADPAWRGKIINMASQAGRRGESLVSAYCASKAAVISITQSTAKGLIPHRINVNGIAPGVVDTPMWDEVDRLFAKYENLPIGEKKRQVGEAVPFGRMGVPEDHAGAAVFLASSDADYVLAQTLNVDGGNWMS